jgi:hypothetical protein
LTKESEVVGKEEVWKEKLFWSEANQKDSQW